MNNKNIYKLWAILCLFFSTVTNSHANNLWINYANEFWIATQWTQSNYAYYSPANLAIDGDFQTFNHTDSSNKNWIQVEVPGLTSISNISIQSRASWTGRIKDAKVYILDKPYSEWIMLPEAVWTLNDTAELQKIDFSEEKLWNYVFVQAREWQNLHIAELEIYGTAQNAPFFWKYEKEFTLSHMSKIWEIITSISAVDLQKNELSYSLSDETYFSINNKWEISVKSALDSWTHKIKVSVTDGTHTTQSEDIFIRVTDKNSIQQALETGKIDKAEEIEILSAISEQINAKKWVLQDAKVKIFNLNSDGSTKQDNSSLTNIDWDPTHDASTFFVNNKYNRNTSLLRSNSVTQEGRTIYKKHLAVLWKTQSWGKYVVFWSNPFRNGINDDMNKVLENTLSYLTSRDDLKTWTWFNVVLSHLDNSYYFRDESKTREWLNKNYSGSVQYNNENTCDNTNLATCISTKTDLIIISQVSSESDDLDAISTTVQSALSQWIPVVYIHHNWNLKPLGQKLFTEVFDVIYEWDNYWKKLQLKSFNPSLEVNSLSEWDKNLLKMIQHFENNDLNFDWSLCEDSNWNKGENNDNCWNVPWYSELKSTFSWLKWQIDQLDRNKINIFTEDGYVLQKLFILLADKYRENTSFPMNKATSDDTAFMKSYYSDHLVYNYRLYNPVQKDLWNFSRSDFSHITPINKTVKLLSKRPFRSAWIYALPWKTFTVTRKDNSDLTVKVFINSLRSASTHELQKNGYSRPKYLQSQRIEIKPWESISLTSPYGWPVQLEFSTNDLDVELDFENIWEHAYWKSKNDNQSFTDKLEANEYDWAEISTPGFEVHSQLNKMVQSIWQWETAENLAAATTKYIANYPLVLAWFKWPWIEVVDEIHNFAEQNKLNVYNIDQVKHMNADQATCWYGCSGNPYDAYWAFSPIWHWDIHEVGHGLEKSRFRFTWFEWHSTTNPYSYYTKTKYNKATKKDPSCQSLPFQSIFDSVKESKNHDDPLVYLQDNFWNNSGWSEQFSVTMQAMMHAEKQWKLKDGWHLLARLHILERNIWFVKSDWENRKNNIWFSSYTLEEFNNISNDDWMLISLSYAAGLDYSDYLKMIGMNYSDKALAQVQSFKYPKVAEELFISTGNWYCKSDKYGAYLDKPSIKMTAQAIWPNDVDVCEHWDYSGSTIDGDCWTKPETWWSAWLWGWGGSWSRMTCLNQHLVCKQNNSWKYIFYKRGNISCKGWNLWKKCNISNSFENFEFKQTIEELKKEDTTKWEIFEKIIQEDNSLAEKQAIIQSVKNNLYYVDVGHYKVLNIKDFKQNQALTKVWKTIDKKWFSEHHTELLIDDFNKIIGLISVYKDTQNKTIKKNIAHELKIDLKEFNKLYKKANIDKRKQNIAASSTDNQLPASKKDIDYKKVKEDILKAHQEKLEKQRELDKQEEEIKTVNTNDDIYTVSVHSVQLKYDRNWKYTTAWLWQWDKVKVLIPFNSYWIWKVEVIESKNPKFIWKQWFISNKFLDFK